MLFEKFKVKGLSHFSYVIGCEKSEEMIVVDPKRDFDTYLQYAEDNALKISYIVETHIHADYASGARELAEKTGATVLESKYDEGETFEIQFPHHDLEDGDIIELECVKIEVLHTPGHTPEHISLLVYDKRENADEPIYLLSGDFIFVGSLGRPDLLGEDAKRKLAQKLYQSVHERIKNLPDAVEVFPAHGAGSLCGSGMGSREHTTLGHERATNPYFDPNLTEEQFVEKILSTVPYFPDYYKRMKRLNSQGAAALDGLPLAKALLPDEFEQAVKQNEAIVLDLRDPLAFGGGHIPGAINLGEFNSLAVWGGQVLPPDKPIYLVLDDEGQVEQALKYLVQVGLDDVRGFLKGTFTGYIQHGKPFESLQQVSVHEAYSAANGNAQIIDVRSKSEFDSGNIKGSRHIYFGALQDELDKLDKETNYYLICGGGYRSSLSASILKKNGFKKVHNIHGGISAWKKAGYEVV